MEAPTHTSYWDSPFLSRGTAAGMVTVEQDILYKQSSSSTAFITKRLASAFLCLLIWFSLFPLMAYKYKLAIKGNMGVVDVGGEGRFFGLQHDDQSLWKLSPQIFGFC